MKTTTTDRSVYISRTENLRLARTPISLLAYRYLLISGITLTVLTAQAQNSNTSYGEGALFEGGPGPGDFNSAFGFDALFFNYDGSRNTGCGANALLQNSSGNDNTAVGWSAGHLAVGSQNTAVGAEALDGRFNSTGGSISTGSYNTATGFQSLNSITNGSYNVANGHSALYANESGAQNTASGAYALYSNNGSYNTACGLSALQFNSTGSNNVALGYNAGLNLTTGNNNIIIGAGVLGNSADANVTRIGKTTQKKVFIGGIYNKTVAGVGVIINSNGQLGTVQSSARYKDDIKPMDKASEAILSLKPVIFRYKEDLDPDKIPQFGLIAEDVDKIDSDLVVRDEDGKVMTVRYDAVNAMLLNEFLKEHRKVATLEATLAEEQKKSQTRAEIQQKQIQALTAAVQKVNDKVELSKAWPQVAVSGQERTD